MGAQDGRKYICELYNMGAGRQEMYVTTPSVCLLSMFQKYV